jgi:hypothetical protein
VTGKHAAVIAGIVLLAVLVYFTIWFFALR